MLVVVRTGCMFRMFEVPNNRDMKVDKWSGSGRVSSKPNKPNN
jgi:hypothetical protein